MGTYPFLSTNIKMEQDNFSDVTTAPSSTVISSQKEGEASDFSALSRGSNDYAVPDLGLNMDGEQGEIVSAASWEEVQDAIDMPIERNRERQHSIGIGKDALYKPPEPTLNSNGSPRVKELSNSVPSFNLPV